MYFEIILNNFPSNISGHIRPSNARNQFLKKMLLAVLVFLWFLGTGR